MKTEYYKLAKRIANRIDGFWYCCLRLPYTECQKFSKMFCPHLDRGSQFFNPGDSGWMADDNESYTQDNEHRVIALLLMHEMTVNPKG